MSLSHSYNKTPLPATPHFKHFALALTAKLKETTATNQWLCGHRPINKFKKWILILIKIMSNEGMSCSCTMGCTSLDVAECKAFFADDDEVTLVWPVSYQIIIISIVIINFCILWVFILMEFCPFALAKRFQGPRLHYS